MDRTRAARPARRGDLLAVHPHHLGEPERLGEILEVIGDPGHEHFRVRWDDEHESIVYPGSDAIVHRGRGKERKHVNHRSET
jgi:hypothetical protein